MTTTPQAALLSAQNPLLKRCYTMSESHLSGYRVVIGFERLEDAQDAHEYIAKLQATQEPVQVFPPRIMELLEQVADRNPGAAKGPWEDAQGLPMQEDADAAISWIKARSVATQEPVQAGELPDEREAFEQWWRQRQLLTFPKDYDQSRLADWGAAYKPAAKDAWQARAALSARKPLTVPDSMSHKAFFQAGAICHEMGYVSVAGVQRKLAIGWNEAKAICQHLHDTGSLAGLEMSPHINGIGLEVKP